MHSQGGQIAAAYEATDMLERSSSQVQAPSVGPGPVAFEAACMLEKSHDRARSISRCPSLINICQSTQLLPLTSLTSEKIQLPLGGSLPSAPASKKSCAERSQ